MIFEVVKLLWPFLKEFFLGKDVTVSQTVKKREYKKLLMLLGMMFSIVINLFLIPKSVILSDEVYKLELKCKKFHCESAEAANIVDENTKLKDDNKLLQDQVDQYQQQQGEHPDSNNPAPPEHPEAPVVSSSPAAAGSDEYWRRYNNVTARLNGMSRTDPR